MAFGLPPSYTELFCKDEISNLKSPCLESIKKLSWVLKDDSSEKIVASVGINFFTLGEKVTIDFKSDNCIAITSKCAVPTQVFDWGKNKNNVKKLIKNIEGLLTDNHVNLKK